MRCWLLLFWIECLHKFGFWAFSLVREITPWPCSSVFFVSRITFCKACLGRMKTKHSGTLLLTGLGNIPGLKQKHQEPPLFCILQPQRINPSLFSYYLCLPTVFLCSWIAGSVWQVSELRTFQCCNSSNFITFKRLPWQFLMLLSSHLILLRSLGVT